MVRFIGIGSIALALACGASASASAQAQEPVVVDLPLLDVRMTAPAGALWATPGYRDRATRGPALPLLYVSLVGLEAYDAYSTTRGLESGAVEANAFLSRLATNKPALWAVKGGIAVASIYAAERLWRDHRRGQAVAVMVASNALMAAVAVSNASVLRRQR